MILTPCPERTTLSAMRIVSETERVSQHQMSKVFVTELVLLARETGAWTDRTPSLERDALTRGDGDAS